MKAQKIVVCVEAKITLWTAIKLAIAGIRINRNKGKITIQELIDAERGGPIA